MGESTMMATEGAGCEQAVPENPFLEPIIYRHVTRQSGGKRFKAGCSIRGKVVYVGTYETQEAAARAADHKLVSHNADPHRLNFPLEHVSYIKKWEIFHGPAFPGTGSLTERMGLKKRRISFLEGIDISNIEDVESISPIESNNENEELRDRNNNMNIDEGKDDTLHGIVRHKQPEVALVHGNETLEQVEVLELCSRSPGQVSERLGRKDKKHIPDMKEKETTFEDVSYKDGEKETIKEAKVQYK